MSNLKSIKLNVNDFDNVKRNDIVRVTGNQNYNLGDTLKIELESKGSKGSQQTINAHVISIESNGRNGEYDLKVQKWSLKEITPKSFFSSARNRIVHYIYVNSEEFYNIISEKFIAECSHDRDFQPNEEVELVNAYSQPLEVENLIIKGVHLNLDHNNDKVNLTFQ